jgi:hypothetical protein
MRTEQTLQRMMPAAGARFDDHLPYIVPATVERRALPTRTPAPAPS